MARIYVPEADALLDVDLPIYGGQGGVRLIDYMGGDSRIVQSARVSFGAGTKTVREDRGLIHHLVRNMHTSPLEKVRFEFLIHGVPLPIATQWIRHRMGSFNFLSYRFSEVEDDAQLALEVSDIRAQSTTNKQVGEGQADHGAAHHFILGLEEVQDHARRVYESAIAGGVAREQARFVLPQSTTTAFFWTVDLHNAFHFLRLRLAWDAQKEIQEPAQRIAECIKAVVPMAYEAFEEHILHGRRFSRTEMAHLRSLVNLGTARLDDYHGESARDLAVKDLGERGAAEFWKKMEA